MTWDPSLTRAIEKFVKRTGISLPFPSTVDDADELASLVDNAQPAGEVLEAWKHAIARDHGRRTPSDEDEGEALARFRAAMALLRPFWESPEGRAWLA